MGLVSSKPNTNHEPDPILEFSCAGIIFTNLTHLLAGYQLHKKKPCITGIGGSRKKGETALETAWRETIEELFDCSVVPQELIRICIAKFVPSRWFSRGEYICFQYSFDDLYNFLKLVKRNTLPMTIYSTYPSTLFELVINRKYSESTEIQSLCILPFVQNNNGSLVIHEEFCMDIDQLGFHINNQI